MKRKTTLFILTTLIFVLISVRDTSTNNTLAQDSTPTLTSAIGTSFTYQGSLTSGGHPANGLFDFIFELYDSPEIGTGTLLGTLTLYEQHVNDGLFTVELAFDDIFDGRALWLEVSVRTSVGEEYTTLVPRQALTATPYAIYAQGGPWSAGDGLELVDTEFRGKGTPTQNVVIVAKSGGDFTSVQAAIEIITDAAANNQYLVWVAPGVYSEMVTMKSYVHLQGAGQEATVITSSVTSNSHPPSQGTIKLASHSSLRDLTVGNNGSGAYNVAVLATAEMIEILVDDVTARTQGSGQTNLNYAIYLTGSDTKVTLQQVTALAENADTNVGLYNTSGAETKLYGGSFTARGGSHAFGIDNNGTNTTLEAFEINALSVDGSSKNTSFSNSWEGFARLHGGLFTARGGSTSIGVLNTIDGQILINNVTIVGESGSVGSYGFYNDTALEAEVSSSKITGSTDALLNGLGIVYVGVTQLDGGAFNPMGSLNCFQVYDGDYNPYTCP